jgi:hypothetical protein
MTCLTLIAFAASQTSRTSWNLSAVRESTVHLLLLQRKSPSSIFKRATGIRLTFLWFLLKGGMGLNPTNGKWSTTRWGRTDPPHRLGKRAQN